MILQRPPFPLRAKGLTLLEFVVASSIVVLLIGVGVSQLNQKQHKAEKVIAQMQMVKTGMLRFNMDYPCSASGLSALVKREDAAIGGCGAANDLSQWKGPYIEGATPLVAENINISSIYIDSFLELRQATIGDTYYQAIALVGTAESELRTSILAQCGRDCQPFPGKSDIGILVNQVSFGSPGDPTELSFWLCHLFVLMKFCRRAASQALAWVSGEDAESHLAEDTNTFR